MISMLNKIIEKEKQKIRTDIDKEIINEIQKGSEIRINCDESYDRTAKDLDELLEYFVSLIIKENAYEELPDRDKKFLNFRLKNTIYYQMLQDTYETYSLEDVKVSIIRLSIPKYNLQEGKKKSLFNRNIKS